MTTADDINRCVQAGDLVHARELLCDASKSDLLQKGALPGSLSGVKLHPVVYAFRTGKWQFAVEVAERCLAVGAKEPLLEVDPHSGYTSGMLFFESGPLSIAKRLLDAGHPLVVRSGRGLMRTERGLLQVAVDADNFEVVQLLLDMGADASQIALPPGKIVRTDRRLLDALRRRGAPLSEGDVALGREI